MYWIVQLASNAMLVGLNFSWQGIETKAVYIGRGPSV